MVCSAGDCVDVGWNTDPNNDCGAYQCGLRACQQSCTKDAYNCSPNCKGWCWDDSCQPKLPGGQGCIGNCQCQSGTCGFPWVCY